MVINAFGQGDTRTLRPLLSNDVYEDFAGAIKARVEAGETLETTVIGVKEAELIEAELQGRTAFATIKFVSEQINVTRDASGELIRTFERPVKLGVNRIVWRLDSAGNYFQNYSGSAMNPMPGCWWCWWQG